MKGGWRVRLKLRDQIRNRTAPKIICAEPDLHIHCVCNVPGSGFQVELETRFAA